MRAAWPRRHELHLLPRFRRADAARRGGRRRALQLAASGGAGVGGRQHDGASRRAVPGRLRPDDRPSAGNDARARSRARAVCREMSTERSGEIPEAIADGDILASREAGGRFLRGSGIRVIAYGSGLLVGLAATPLVTRHLGPVDWGHFITVTSVIFIAAALTEGGVGNLGVREFSTGDEAERRSFMSSLLGLRIVLSLAGAGGGEAFVVCAG